MKLFLRLSVTVYPESIPSQQKEHFINVLNMSRADKKDFITMSSHQINSLLICSDYL